MHAPHSLCAEQTALSVRHAREWTHNAHHEEQPPRETHLHSPLSRLVGLHNVGMPEVHAVHGFQGAPHRG